MSAHDIFLKHFQSSNLKRIYKEVVLLSAATGIDNMSHEVFWRFHDHEIETIRRKCLAGTYRFNKYKLKLISKGKGKAPREISIPTIRDRIALRAICDFLQEVYAFDLNFELPQNMVVKVNNIILSKQYDYFMKFDVANFYPSIRHNKLISRLRAKIRDENILSLIGKAISSPTVSKPNASDKANECGVPQGLSISNILAAIYLMNIDKHFASRDDVSYFRYVDDLMILCRSDKAESLIESVLVKFRRLGLKIYDPIKNPEKSSMGLLTESKFGYLGYYFSEGGKVSARDGSVDNLRQSLLSIFTGFKHSSIKSQEFLTWRINLRITGCVFQSKSKGWLYFFSEINDITLLHSLGKVRTSS
ncbi:reverse transcriptase/maturase family protein [Enterobacter hormaechei subsp. steigerwaltii]|nr:reverse transcriptase/maturase family protein [Enterobacter hormaechei subsp. steigerwaltii]MCU2575130.1 reverse transcriptase/maturase family protein [Enterobacter hormaechei subsp. steigerwaltii]MCU2620315.1 reverse transcriptase/maturase family protein [Enterobacter hormaechei subsp. steigerwaltii]MCU2739655.1 reverse transcriptase/maturase family protein [Enterobacter hormaechei subsp. xiangfangensis]